MLRRQVGSRINSGAIDLVKSYFAHIRRTDSGAVERMRAWSRNSTMFCAIRIGLDQEASPTNLFKVVTVAEINAVISTYIDEKSVTLLDEEVIQPSILAILGTKAVVCSGNFLYSVIRFYCHGREPGRIVNIEIESTYERQGDWQFQRKPATIFARHLPATASKASARRS